jgi:hypothetical protein
MRISATVRLRLSPITRRCGAAMRDECFDIPDCLLALFE